VVTFGAVPVNAGPFTVSCCAVAWVVLPVGVLPPPPPEPPDPPEAEVTEDELEEAPPWALEPLELDVVVELLEEL
jgi:hypothetical protein